MNLDPELSNGVLYLSGPVGWRGAKAQCVSKRERLLRRFSSRYLSEAENRELPPVTAPLGAVTFPLGKGGLYAGLWELSETLGAGFFVDLRAVPICQDTVEIFEELGLDPYGQDSLGVTLLAVLPGTDVGGSFTRIGQLHPEKKKELLRGDTVRCLNRPKKPREK